MTLPWIGLGKAELNYDPSARPQTGPEELDSLTRAAAGNGPISRFGPFWVGFWPWDWSQRLGNGHGMPGVDSQVLATILDPFRAIFAD